MPVPPTRARRSRGRFRVQPGRPAGSRRLRRGHLLDDPDRQYGRIRLLASLSFAITSIAVGFVYDRLGYGVASVAYIVFAIVLVLAVLRTSSEGRPRRGREAGGAPAGMPAQVAFRLDRNGLPAQPHLLPILAAVAVTWFAVIVSFTFLSLRIVGLGGQASDVALSFGVSAFAEIPGMMLAARLANRIGLRGMFCAGAFLYGLAFLLWAVLRSPEAIVATRAITGVAYGAMTVGMVLTIERAAPGAPAGHRPGALPGHRDRDRGHRRQRGRRPSLRRRRTALPVRRSARRCARPAA